MDIHVELRYDGFNSVQQIGYTSLGGLFFLLGPPQSPNFFAFSCAADKKELTASSVGAFPSHAY